jgi:hypothetical protein
VREKTGVKPGIYTSKSVLFSYDWTSVAKAYPLWVAQYPNYEETGFKSEPWTDDWDFGAWDSPLIFQYASTGRIPGYAGHLDLDLFYGTKADRKARCKAVGSNTAEAVKEVAISRANVAEQWSTFATALSAAAASQGVTAQAVTAAWSPTLEPSR